MRTALESQNPALFDCHLTLAWVLLRHKGDSEELANSLPPHCQPTVLLPTLPINQLPFITLSLSLTTSQSSSPAVQQTFNFHLSDNDASISQIDDNWSDKEVEANTDDHNFEEPELPQQSAGIPYSAPTIYEH